ncbi:hypothetical protein WJX73_002957 [Symbiochloris irregularis]|uniref:Uncharacterized protein n=1 Tax=Symbiochloris irregularis TaxID=706552 RepID=A0AAW1PIV0_9CHLO
MEPHKEAVVEDVVDRSAQGQASQDDAPRLARAKGYPYPRPAASFCFVGGEAWPFPDFLWRGMPSMTQLQVQLPTEEFSSVSQALTARGIDPASLPPAQEWTPVLGIGSNGSPEQLARKFPPSQFPQAVIPTVRCALRDFDVVYAPLISSYGSCTATLQHSPGTSVEVALTYLTPPLLERMHATEGAYTVVRLTDIHLALGVTPQSLQQGKSARTVSDHVLVYVHSDGTLCPPFAPNGQPVAIKEVPAVNRQFQALTQTEMQIPVRIAKDSGYV